MGEAMANTKKFTVTPTREEQGAPEGSLPARQPQTVGDTQTLSLDASPIPTDPYPY
jgi:hypothetical protein